MYVVEMMLLYIVFVLYLHLYYFIVMNHCDKRGSEAYCGELAHCLLHEQCGAAQLGGVNLRPLRSNEDGTFDLDELESKFRRDRDHEPISKLVLVENTLNGKIIPQRWIKELVQFCKRHDLKLHMDGARLWNASIESNISAKEIVSGFDSVTFCLSKGLGNLFFLSFPYFILHSNYVCFIQIIFQFRRSCWFHSLWKQRIYYQSKKSKKSAWWWYETSRYSCCSWIRSS